MAGALQSPTTADAWAAHLAARLQAEVEVRFGRSRTRPIQLWRYGGRLRLRLHRMFASSPGEVVEAVVEWTRTHGRGAGANAVLDEFVEARLAEHVPPAPPATPVGDHHRLDAYAAELAATIAELPEPPQIGWARPRRRSGRSARLGSYDVETHSIRISRLLDQPFVPAHVVRFVLFHELLHALIPPRRDDRGRWIRHGADFRARERSHPDHARAEAWLRQNHQRLLRGR